MKKKDAKDPYAIFADFQRQLATHNLSTDAMYEEVRMMRFKIRPLSGNVLTLNLRDKHFIEALWNLGKLDEFFHEHYYDLNSAQKKIFFEMFDGLHSRFETELNKLNIYPMPNISPLIEMEIFKDYPGKKNHN